MNGARLFGSSSPVRWVILLTTVVVMESLQLRHQQHLARDGAIVPRRLGAEEALLVSQKFQLMEEQFSQALDNDRCAPQMCAPSAQVNLGQADAFFDAMENDHLKVRLLTPQCCCPWIRSRDYIRRHVVMCV